MKSTRLGRREFIVSATSALAMPNILTAQEKKPRVWANLIHLGRNLWNDQENSPDHPAFDEKGERRPPTWGVSNTIRFDEKMWHDLTERMHDIGMNTVVIDLAEALVYPSHPELAVKGSWTPAKMREELARLRKMGIDPVPKLNFSCCHDTWMKDYARMVSTQPYYQVVRDLIADVCEIFDRPKYVHIGMDEELAVVQTRYDHAVARSGDLLYHDIDFYVNEIERHGSRAWMFADGVWQYKGYAQRTNKRALQTNWYYWKDVKTVEPEVLEETEKNMKLSNYGPGQNHAAELRGFLTLDKAGFDQIPCGSNWNNPHNMMDIAEFSFKHISPERLKGFLTMTWAPTLPTERYLKKHDEYFVEMEKVIKRFG